jgi:hypothetical protein
MAKNSIPLFGRENPLGERCCLWGINDEWYHPIILALLQMMYVMGVELVRKMCVAKEDRMTGGWEGFYYG